MDVSIRQIVFAGVWVVIRERGNQAESNELDGREVRQPQPCTIVAFTQRQGEEAFVSVVLDVHVKRLPEELDGEIEYEQTEVIEEIPIKFPQNNRYASTLPIQVGDRGALVFADIDIEKWKIDSEAEPDTSFYRDVSDCWYEPGLYPRPMALNDYNTEALEDRTADRLTYRILIDSYDPDGGHTLGQSGPEAAQYVEARQLRLISTGFEVYARVFEDGTNDIVEVGLLEVIEKAFRETAGAFEALVLEPYIVNKPIYQNAADRNTKMANVVAGIKGGVAMLPDKESIVQR